MSSEGLPGWPAQCQRHRRLLQRGLESDSAHCPQHGQSQSAAVSTRDHPAGRLQHQTWASHSQDKYSEQNEDQRLRFHHHPLSEMVVWCHFHIILASIACLLLSVVGSVSFTRSIPVILSASFPFGCPSSLALQGALQVIFYNWCLC